jgi:GntR family transcriptional regulator
MQRMTTGPTDARTLQVRIADDIRAKIETGDYPPGSQLPTYDELAADYLCSLAVVRKAVDLLRQQGLVVTLQGKGSYVRERPVARRHGVSRYSRSRWKAGQAVLIAEAARQGHTVNQLMRFLGEVPAPPEVAQRLNIPPGSPVFVRRRTTLINDRPNQLADSYYPLSVTAQVPQLMDEETGPGGGFARIEEAGRTLGRIREEMSVRMPSGPETVNLKLPDGTPVVELIRTTQDENGEPVEVMLATIAGDMITFDYDFPIPD